MTKTFLSGINLISLVSICASKFSLLDWHVETLGKSFTKFWMNFNADLDHSFFDIYLASFHGFYHGINKISLILLLEYFAPQLSRLFEINISSIFKLVSADLAGHWELLVCK